MLDPAIFNENTPLSPFTGKVWRVVESQEQIATLGLVDNMQEQGVLESLLDAVKPPYRSGTEGMHYLLKTAFRYPPLKFGSRFGTRLMPSFLYASLSIKTALYETAYYRFLFLEDMQTPYQKYIDSEHTVFSISINTHKSLNLRVKPFTSLCKSLLSRDNYSFTQAVGAWAVNDKQVDVIEFESVRLQSNSNVAIAEPSCIRSRKPLNYQKWICRTTNNVVSFNHYEHDALTIQKSEVFT